MPEAIACTGCGLPPFKGKKFCQSCGADTNSDAVMCIKCGCSLKKSSSINISGATGSAEEIKDKLVSDFNSFSNDQKISAGAGVLMAISVFLPWFEVGSKGVSLFDAEQSVHALILIALAGATVFFNFTQDFLKAKYASLGALGYFCLTLVIQEGDISDVLDYAAIGLYLYLISALACVYFSNKASQ